MTATTALETLTEARDLVNRGWCQHVFAEDGEGEEVVLGCEDICKLCLTGALFTALGASQQEYHSPEADIRAKGRHALLERAVKRIGVAINNLPDVTVNHPEMDEPWSTWKEDLAFGHANWHDLSTWNDFDETDKDQVLAVLDAAIAYERKEQTA